MKYCAKIYTAFPHVGLIFPGEMLTDEMASMMGEEKIAEMVSRGILKPINDGKVFSEPPASSGDGNDSSEQENAEDDPGDNEPGDTGEENDEEAGMPELGVDDCVISDQEQPEKEAVPERRKTARSRRAAE